MPHFLKQKRYNVWESQTICTEICDIFFNNNFLFHLSISTTLSFCLLGVLSLYGLEAELYNSFSLTWIIKDICYFSLD